MKFTLLDFLRGGATAAFLLLPRLALPAQEVTSATIMSTATTPVMVAPVYHPKSQLFGNQFVVDASQWHANGELTNSESGLSGNNFSLISATTTGPENIAPFYEASMTLKLASSGGVYDLYLGASQNAMAGELSTGQYYALEISNLTFGGNNCQARAQLLESQDGVTTVLATKQVACHDGITFHAALRRNYQLVAYADKESIFSAMSSFQLYGQPGVGGRNIPEQNGISAINADFLSSTHLRFHSDLQGPVKVISSKATTLQFQWPAPKDYRDAHVGWYSVYRDGTYLGQTTIPEYTDTNLSPATTYNYEIQNFTLQGQQGSSLSFSLKTAMLADSSSVNAAPATKANSQTTSLSAPGDPYCYDQYNCCAVRPPFDTGQSASRGF